MPQNYLFKGLNNKYDSGSDYPSKLSKNCFDYLAKYHDAYLLYIYELCKSTRQNLSNK